MDPLFKEVGIYSALGQRYEPVDSELVLSYREATDGQVLEEGITEAGLDGQLPGGRHLLRDPRPGDDPVLHLLLDVRLPAHRRPDVGVRGRARARLPDGRHGRADDADRRGAPARRRPLARSWPRPSRTCAPTTRPSPTSWRRSSATASSGCTGPSPRTSSTTSRSTTRTTRSRRGRSVTDEAILRGIYRFAAAPDLGRDAHPARLVGSGSILQQVLAARDLLAEKFGVAAEVYSAPSFPLLRRDALAAERWNRLHPDAKKPRVPLRQHDPAVRGRADRGRHGLDEGAARHGVAAGCRRTTSPSGPTASVGAIRARRSGACSRSIRRTSPPRRSSASPVAGRYRRRRRPRRIAELGIEPDKADPLAL